MIKLYINGKEIDCAEAIDYTINRTFESASDPTKLQNDFSKTIKIPITANNVAVFGEWQRADRVTLGGGVDGYYYDANAKIPFELENDGALLLKGYAKFSKASYSSTDKSFEITLSSLVSDWYSTLKELTAVEMDESGILPTDKIDRWRVHDCWEHTHNFEDFQDFADVFGFSMCNNGTYKDFKNGNILVNSTDNPVVSIAQGDQYEGWNSEYRSYYQRPYVRVDALFYYIKQISAKYEYKLKLDRSFFNAQNPYYAKAILLCNLLDTSKGDTQLNEYRVDGYRGEFSTQKQMTSLVTTSEAISGVIADDTFVYQEGYDNYITIYNLSVKSYVQNAVLTGYIELMCGSNVIAKSDLVQIKNGGLYTFANTKISTLSLKGRAIAGGNLYVKFDAIVAGNVVINSVPKIRIELKERNRSNSTLNCERILGESFKPVQFIIDYCKVFGLHFIAKDGAIEIVSRERLFRDGTEKELKLDRSTFEIAPYRFEHGYEIWGYKDTDVTYAKDYKELNGYAYGAKKLQTHYKFNSDENTLLNTFNTIVNENAIRWYLTSSYDASNVQGELRYNGIALPTFTNKDNDTWSSVESCYALCFEDEVTRNTGSVTPFISDDSTTEITNEEYCWHANRQSNEPIISKIKFATTFLTFGGHNYAFLFVQPNALYLTNSAKAKEKVGDLVNCKYIYQMFWADYIEEDRYADDSKTLTTMAVFNPTQFQQFSFGDLYNIDGVNWHINKITDYNPNSIEPVKVELVKVKNKLNYYANRSYGSGEISNSYCQFDTFRTIVSGEAQTASILIYSNVALIEESFVLPTFCKFVSIERATAIGSDALYLTLQFYTRYKVAQEGYVVVDGNNIGLIEQEGKQAILNVSANNVTLTARLTTSVEVESNGFDKLQLIVDGAITTSWGDIVDSKRKLLIHSTATTPSTASVVINYVDGATQNTQRININIVRPRITIGTTTRGQQNTTTIGQQATIK